MPLLSHYACKVCLCRLSKISLTFCFLPLATILESFSRISLLIFCLDDLSIGDRMVLKSPTTTTTLLEFIYVFRSLIVYA
jgi:hypothetical protein